MAPITTLTSLIHNLAARSGPVLTWYGEERIELTGKVLANWVVKTTNFLVEELDANPQCTIHLDLPPHWRTFVWALACWNAGATVTLSPAADIVITAHPTRDHKQASDVVAVTLPALARSYPGDLPDGSIDANAVVMGYPDHLGWIPPHDLGACAFQSPEFSVTYRELDELIQSHGDQPERIGIDTSLGLATILIEALQALGRYSSIVLFETMGNQASHADATHHQGIVQSEGITRLISAELDLES